LRLLLTAAWATAAATGTGTTATAAPAISHASGAAATTAAFAGAFVKFLAATAWILALRSAATTARLLHAAAAGVLTGLVPQTRLRFGRAGAVAGGQRDLEFIQLVPFGVGTIAIGNGQQFLHAGAR